MSDHENYRTEFKAHTVREKTDAEQRNVLARKAARDRAAKCEGSTLGAIIDVGADLLDAGIDLLDIF